MNTPLPDNEIHTNLVSMNEIKAGNINNIKHIPKGKRQNNENLNIRMQINKKPIYKALYFDDYLNDGILDESSIILDATKIKHQLAQYSNKVTEILDEEELNKGNKKITGLGIKTYKGSIMFYFRLHNNEESGASSLVIDENNFDKTFYESIDKYLEIQRKLGFPKIDVDEKYQLYKHIGYYRQKYNELHKEKLFIDQKNNFINMGFINNEGIILSISSHNDSLVYINDGDQRKFTRKNTQENIIELIEKFVLHNGIELGGDFHKFLLENKIFYSQYYQNKLKNI